MTARSTLALVALLACTAVHADYDPKLEAQEAAQRKAAAQEKARKEAEVRKTRGDAEQNMMRQVLGKEAIGKSDTEVKTLYDAKMGAYMKQAKEAEKTYGKATK